MRRRSPAVGDEPRTGRRGYRELATPQLFVWAMVSLTGKLPIAMSTLAMVFLVRETPGGYTLGATLAGTYVVGEVVGAPILGTRLDRRRIRAQLVAGFAVGAVAFAGLAFGRLAPPAVLLPLAFLAGAAPSASPGGLRQLLTVLVAEEDVPRAFSAEGVLTQVTWASAPALVAVLALQVAPGAPVILASGCALLAAGLVLLVRPGRTAGATMPERPASRARTLASAWPIYLTSAAAMSVVAAAELSLPALLEYRRLPVGLAGVLLTAFSAASAAGAYCYGLRRWPGSVRAQGLILLCGTATFVATTALVPLGYGIAVGLLTAGFFQAGVLITRSLSVREHLPADLHAAGYSVMYGMQGIGYAVTAVAVAVLLAGSTPPAAILAGVLVTYLLTAVSAIAERRAGHRAEPSTKPTMEANV